MKKSRELLASNKNMLVVIASYLPPEEQIQMQLVSRQFYQSVVPIAML